MLVITIKINPKIPYVRAIRKVKESVDRKYKMIPETRKMKPKTNKNFDS
ncbi:MAG: hypothetical protein ACP5IT_01645 [Thermoproteota archaeon]